MQPGLGQLDDRVLVMEAQAGDNEAFSELYRRYYPAMLRLAWGVLRDRHKAEDAAQEALWKAFRNLPRFQGRGAFSTWIYRITRNEAVNICRASRCRGVSAPELTLHGLPAADPFARAEAAAILRAGLSSLEPAQQRLLRWRYHDDLTNEQIARLLGRPVGTVKSRVHRAARRLRQVLEQGACSSAE